MNELIGKKENQWLRLSPWSIVYFIARTLKGMADPNILIMAAPLYGLYQLLENSLIAIALIATIIPAGIISYSIISYCFFHYRLDGNKLLIKKGMIFKRRLDLPFERIQDIHIDKPFYFKPVGLVSATIDTAGSNQQEAVLAAIDYSKALSLREAIVNQQTPLDTPEDSAEKAIHQSKTDIILTRSTKDLFIHGISNNKAWIILAMLFPFLDRAFEGTADKLMNSSLLNINELAQTSALLFGILIFGAALIFVIGMMVLSIAGSIISLHNFKLSKGEDTLSRESGLFSRHQVNLKHRRLQLVSIRQGLVDRLFSRFNIYFHQVSTQQTSQQQSRQSFMVPSVNATEISGICKEIYNELDLNLNTISQELQPISRRYILQQIILTTIPMVLIVGSIITSNEDSLISLYYLPLLFLIVCGCNYLRWKKWGYYLSKDHLIVRRGFLGTVYDVFPTFKAQQTALKQNVFMRLNDHCNLEVLIGASNIKIPYIKKHQGLAILDSVLFEVESCRRSWM